MGNTPKHCGLPDESDLSLTARIFLQWWSAEFCKSARYTAETHTSNAGTLLTASL